MQGELVQSKKGYVNRDPRVKQGLKKELTRLSDIIGKLTQLPHITLLGLTANYTKQNIYKIL